MNREIKPSVLFIYTQDSELNELLQRRGFNHKHKKTFWSISPTTNNQYSYSYFDLYTFKVGENGEYVMSLRGTKKERVIVTKSAYDGIMENNIEAWHLAISPACNISPTWFEPQLSVVDTNEEYWHPSERNMLNRSFKSERDGENE